MSGNHRIYFASPVGISSYFFGGEVGQPPTRNQASCASMCLPGATANDCVTPDPRLSRLAISSTATSLARIGPSGVPPADGVDMVAIVVCALVRMIELGRSRQTWLPKKHEKKKKGHGNTYVPALTSSESLACFFASIMYNPVPKAACSISSPAYPPLITADHMVGFGLLCIGPKMGSA